MSERTIPIFDSDTHVTEPPDLWTSRVASKWGDLVPHVRFDPGNAGEDKDGISLLSTQAEDAWYIGEEKIAGAASSAPAGWKEPYPSHPPTLAEALPSTYDASERLKYMDEMGIAANVLFPNVAGLGSQIFLKLKEPKLMLECARAYNDFLIDWVAPDPKRFVPMCCTTFWDVETAPAEIERAAKMGHRGLVFTGTPQSHGLPLLADRHWDPIWAAAQACNMPICFHVGSGDFDEMIDPDYIKSFGLKTFFALQTTKTFLENGNQLADLLLSGILPRFPELKFISVESGIGWIPFVLESVDYHFQVGEAAKERPEFKMLPSEYFHRQVYGCYWFERTAPKYLLEAVGVNNILFETDFPHPTCLYGREAIDSHIEAGLGGQPEAVQRRILHDNAAELFGFDLS